MRARHTGIACAVVLSLGGCAGPGGSGPGMSVANDSSAQSADSCAQSNGSSQQSGSQGGACSWNGSSMPGGSSDPAHSSDPGGSSAPGGTSDPGTSAPTSSQGTGDASRQSSPASAQSSKWSGQTSDASFNGSGSAQPNTSNDVSGSGTDSRAVLSTTLVGATVTAIGIVIWSLATRPPSNKDFVPWKTGKVALAWLLANGHELREDLVFGEGPAIDDLAAAAGIPRSHLARFGRLLATHRNELWRLASPERLDVRRALSLLSRVGEIARADPLLHEDYLAFVAAHGPKG